MTSNYQAVPEVLRDVASGYPFQRRYASNMLPLVQALTVRDTYKLAKLGNDFLKPDQLERPYGAEPKRYGENPAGYADVVCTRYSIEAAVDWAELNGAEDVFKTKLLTLEARTRNSTEKLLNSIEVGQVTLLTTAASYNGNTVTLSGNDLWDNESSDIVAQVQTYKDAIKGKIGVYPNQITISESVWNKIKNKKNLLDKLPTTALRSGLTPEVFGEIVGIPNVYIGDTMFKTGLNGALNYTWGKNVVLAYNPTIITDIEHTPMFGATILRPLGYKDIRYYEDEQRTSDVVAIDRFLGYKIATPEAGFLVQNAIS